MAKDLKPELFNDSFQNFRSKQIPKAQLILCDPPYNLGGKAFASSPSWYIGGIIRMEKARMQMHSSFITITNFVLLSSCTSAQRCLSKNQSRPESHLVW